MLKASVLQEKKMLLQESESIRIGAVSGRWLQPVDRGICKAFLGIAKSK